MLITHDLGVVAEICDEVAVMYAGEIVERAPVDALFDRPEHPYTVGLMGSLPRIDQQTERLATIEGVLPDMSRPPAGCRFAARCPFVIDRCEAEPPPFVAVGASHWSRCIRTPLEKSRIVTALLEVDNLVRHFVAERSILGQPKVVVRAVDGVSFKVDAGKTLALVGEFGCGKSTVGRLILRLIEAQAGHIRFEGRDIAGYSADALRAYRRKAQIIFQDPYASLNPRMTIAQTLTEPLALHGLAEPNRRRQRVDEILRLVGLEPRFAQRYPHEFSGGQRQRIAIARAIAVEPKLIVCDEPVSALDVSIRSQILNLLRDLQQKLGLAYVFISHDLAVVKHVADAVAVMNLGQIVEAGPASALFDAPRHPYSRALLSAIPIPSPSRDRTRVVLSGELPSAINPPAGCRFHTRCPYVIDRCRTERPALAADTTGHAAACHRTAELPNFTIAARGAGTRSATLDRLTAAFTAKSFSTKSEVRGRHGVHNPD